GAIPTPLQLGSNQGRVVEGAFDGLPDHGLDGFRRHTTPAMRRHDILKRWAGAAIVPVPSRIGDAVHPTATLSTVQPSADKEIFVLAVALRLDLVALELRPGGLERGLVDDRRDGDWRPFLGGHSPPAG